MSAATERSPWTPRLLALLALMVLVLLALLLMAPPALGDEGRGGEPKACCHPARAADDAPLPEGMTALAGDLDATPTPAAPVLAPAPGPSPTPAQDLAGGAGAAVTLATAALLDQDGREVRFPGEALGDRIVVMDFVFTTCTTICPILSAKLARLQERLGARAGAEVGLVSISIDPARDTPARLKAFAARYRAGPGWTWLTGDPGDVERVLKGLGAFSPAFTEHAPMMLVGDARTGRFVRLNGFPETERLLAAVDDLARARRALAGAGGDR